MELCFVEQRLFFIHRSLSITIARLNNEYSKHTQIRRHNIYTARSHECTKGLTHSCRERLAWFRPQCTRFFWSRLESLQTSRVRPKQMQSSRSQSFFCVPMESQSQTCKSEQGYLNRNRSGVVQPRWDDPSSSNPPNLLGPQMVLPYVFVRLFVDDFVLN